MKTLIVGYVGLHSRFCYSQCSFNLNPLNRVVKKALIKYVYTIRKRLLICFVMTLIVNDVSQKINLLAKNTSN